MKKVLLGTSALAAAAMLSMAPAQAQDGETSPGPFIMPGGALDITVGGYVETRLHFADRKISEFGTGDPTNGQTVNFRNDQELQVTARGVHDPSGIEYGARMEIELGGNGATNANFDEAWIFFRGNFGEFRLGNEDDVMDDLKLGAPAIAAGTGGIDGDQFTTGPGVRINDSNEATKIRYVSPRFAGFQIGANYAPQTTAQGQAFGSSNGNGWRNYGAVAANYLNTFGGVDVGGFAGYNTGNGNEGNSQGNLSGYAFGALLGYAGFNVSGYYGDGGEQVRKDWNVGISGSLGPTNVSVGYGVTQNINAGDDETVVLSTDTGIMPGVSLQTELAWSELDNQFVGAQLDNEVTGWEGLVEIVVGF